MFVGDTTTFTHIIKGKDGNIVDISTAEKMELRFARPDQTGFTRTATLSTDGLDGKLQYITLPTDLNIHGKWQRQPYVKLPTGEWSAQIHDFAVEAKLKGS